jgi:uncharacterized membrane protein
MTIYKYKKNKLKDWAFILDWIMVIFVVILFVSAVPTLQVDKWGLDSWYMHKLLFLGLGYLLFRCYINQSRIYEILNKRIDVLGRKHDE